MTPLEEKVRAKVNTIIDPETGLTFGEMKLIKELKEKEPGVVRIIFRPSSPICPIALKLAYDIKDVAMKVDGVNKAVVHCRDHLMQETINSIINAPATTSTATT
jgi:metal-sulfur cluster biosynthetic enzyme